MFRPSVDEMLANKQTRYALVIAVAKRAREISAQFEEDGTVTEEKPVLMAIEEFKAHKYNVLEPEIND
ncbi:MAG TPA: DNA-directed RNA polymerase subunit omega [Clostridiales bacterium]|nr:DNA-directed RNA polymerase subunit omega [Clostridiales bacterium]